MVSERATTLKQAFQACDLGALTGAAIDRYSVNLSTGRIAQSMTKAQAQANCDF